MLKHLPLPVRYRTLSALLLVALAFCATLGILAGSPAQAAGHNGGSQTLSLLYPVDTATATPTPDCGLAWRIFPNPTPPPGENVLFGVAATSAFDAWAVGYYGSPARPLIERWDGSAWSITSSPSVGDDWLTDVAAVSATDVWAVGFSMVTGGVQPLALHLVASTWTVVQTPNYGSTGSLLETISAVGPDDIWAVGYSFNPNQMPYVLHWDGSVWTNVTPPGYPYGALHHVSAVSANDVWAAGGSLVLHWDGLSWVQQTLPPVSGMWLSGVKAFSANDVWVAGSYNSSAHALALHWDGVQWTQEPIPDPPTGTYHELFNVQGLAPNDVWALGRLGYGTSDNLPIVEHWNGTAWSLVDAPQVQSLLQDIAPISATEAWAVGANEIPNNRSQLIERYSAGDGDCGTATPTGVPSSTATRTPTRTATPTPTVMATNTATASATAHTPVPPTATQTATPTLAPPSATATPCTISFSDVHPDEYFYEPVRYLYCAGVVSGYSDGTFRPYNNATRAQAAKIVVLAEGWELQNPAEPAFNDVEPGSTFYTYIETAVSHGIAGGYSDGTFRPQNNITRGQISKMVVLAEGWPLAGPAAPTFSDVQPGSTFFRYIETAFEHGIIVGYSDGTFRPHNNALRGQISKIVYLATQGRR